MDIFERPSGDESGGVKLAKTWRTFLAIAIPLSIITCSLAFAWLLYSGRRAKVYDDSEKQPVEGREFVGTKFLGEQGKLSPVSVTKVFIENIVEASLIKPEGTLHGSMEREDWGSAARAASGNGNKNQEDPTKCWLTA